MITSSFAPKRINWLVVGDAVCFLCLWIGTVNSDRMNRSPEGCVTEQQVPLFRYRHSQLQQDGRLPGTRQASRDEGEGRFIRNGVVAALCSLLINKMSRRGFSVLKLRKKLGHDDRYSNGCGHWQRIASHRCESMWQRSTKHEGASKDPPPPVFGGCWESQQTSRLATNWLEPAAVLRTFRWSRGFIDICFSSMAISCTVCLEMDVCIWGHRHRRIRVKPPTHFTYGCPDVCFAPSYVNTYEYECDEVTMALQPERQRSRKPEWKRLHLSLSSVFIIELRYGKAMKFMNRQECRRQCKDLHFTWLPTSGSAQ
jgi:hypothetical protein